MTDKSLRIGRPVLLAGFPAATDQDLPGRPEGQPMITSGSISCFDSDFKLAAAAYPGGRTVTLLLQAAGPGAYL